MHADQGQHVQAWCSLVWVLPGAVQGQYWVLHAVPQVQKSAKHYTEAAYDEIMLLKQIRDGDPDVSEAESEAGCGEGEGV